MIGAPWLSTVTPLYVDHYHLALDPIVFALLGLGAGVLWRRAAGRAVAAVVVGGIVAWNLVAVPSRRSTPTAAGRRGSRPGSASWTTWASADRGDRRPEVQETPAVNTR